MKPSLLITFVGLEKPIADQAQALVPKIGFDSRVFDDSLAENPLDPLPNAIVCGMPEQSDKAFEIAQTLRMNHPDTPIYLVTNRRDGFDRAVLMKNGFTDAFLFPTDEFGFKNEILRVMALASDGEVKAYRSIQLIDIQPDAVLGFDLYLHLPANNKKVRFVSSKDALGNDKAERLKKHNMSSAMVSENQVQEFFKFTARQLKSLGKGDKLTETEKRERRERAIRDLFAGIFGSSGKADTISQGRELMNSAQGIVKAYIVEGDQKTSWYSKLMDVASAPNTPYNHAANTATFAALLSIGLGIGDPKDLALAGLLHDIGLAELPSEISSKKIEDMTPQEFEVYSKHPMHSIALIKERKIIVSERVMKIIEQHHERFDGQGYPAKMAGPRVLPEAQVLGLADALDELTSVSDGRARLSMADAIEKICGAGLDNPSASPIDPSLLGRVCSMFKKSA